VAELVNIGTLAAFFLVCVGVILLRYSHPDVARPFRTPLMPFVPLAGAASCLYLMAQLPAITWLRFAGWLAVGLAIYFFYSRRRSALAADPIASAG
jgi:APA family basic amino acid/polyamine antiporter